jgi:hypothetical protein
MIFHEIEDFSTVVLFIESDPSFFMKEEKE